MRPSFTVVIRQCSANCMQLPSPQLHFTCVLFHHIHVRETIYTALPRDVDDNDGATEANGADGTSGRSTWKNEKYSYPRPFQTWFGNFHIWVADTAKLCTDTARLRTYTVDSLRRRDIPRNSVSKRDMSSNGVQKPYIEYRDCRQHD